MQALIAVDLGQGLCHLLMMHRHISCTSRERCIYTNKSNDPQLDTLWQRWPTDLVTLEDPNIDAQVHDEQYESYGKEDREECVSNQGCEGPHLDELHKTPRLTLGVKLPTCKATVEGHKPDTGCMHALYHCIRQSQTTAYGAQRKAECLVS